MLWNYLNWTAFTNVKFTACHIDFWNGRKCHVIVQNLVSGAQWSFCHCMIIEMTENAMPLCNIQIWVLVSMKIWHDIMCYKNSQLYFPKIDSKNMQSSFWHGAPTSNVTLSVYLGVSVLSFCHQWKLSNKTSKYHDFWYKGVI